MVENKIISIITATKEQGPKTGGEAKHFVKGNRDEVGGVSGEGKRVCGSKFGSVKNNIPLTARLGERRGDCVSRVRQG